jgi:hypothetical protein
MRRALLLTLTLPLIVAAIGAADAGGPPRLKTVAQPLDREPFALRPKSYSNFGYEFERYSYLFHVWRQLGYDSKTSPEIWHRELQRRFGTAAAEHVEAGLQRASEVLPMIVAAVYPKRLLPATQGRPERESLGTNLADYAKNEGTDLTQFESFIDAARRILAGGTTNRRPPDVTSLWFDAAADAIVASVRAAEATIGERRNAEFDATMIDLRILAQLARFHARRAIAAVHYNLFLRGLKLAELLAATLQEKQAVNAWRELVAIVGDRHGFDLAMGSRAPELSGHWRDELRKLESNLRELEEQCCPPDEAILKEPVWMPLLKAPQTDSSSTR